MSEKIDRVEFSRAKSKAKKIRAVFYAKDKKKATREFGARGMKDFTIYSKEGKEIAEQKKKAYLSRHSKLNENWNKSGLMTAGFLSRWILWNKPTISGSLKDIQKRFNIKIKNQI